MEQRIQYTTTTDGVRIAYSVMGSGPFYVYDAGTINHLKAAMEIEPMRVAFERLAARCTLVRFDHRATGLSQRDRLPTSLDDLVADLEAVVSAVNLETFALGGWALGGPIVAKFALRHPDEVSNLVLFDTSVRQPWESPAAARAQAVLELAATDWNLFTETVASVVFGWSAGEEARKMARYFRECTSPEAMSSSLLSMRTEEGWPGLIGKLGLPTLVVKHEEGFFVPMEAVIELTSQIPNAELVLLDGTWITTNERAIRSADVVLDFIGGTTGPKKDGNQDGSAFRTVLFTDLVAHTEMMSRLGDEKGREVLREHERITREVLKEHGGTEVKTMGDGFMASFGSVTRAVECASALQKAFTEREGEPLSVRVGLNAGEPIEEEGDLFGATVILASRIAAKAGAGEILVADTVRGLCSGKGFLFADRGEFVAKGFEEPVRVYEVRWGDEG
jgi:class 3 adenylate cyclase